MKGLLMKKLSDFNIENKTNILTLEDEDEVFVDCLRDLLFEDKLICKQKKIKHGTYENSFELIDIEENGVEADVLVRCNFYEIEESVYLRARYADYGDGDSGLEELYWEDEQSNDIPSQREDFVQKITENMDIFFDDDDY